MKTCFKEACFCGIFDRANAPMKFDLVPGFNTVTRAEIGRLNTFVLLISLMCLINFEKNPFFLCHVFIALEINCILFTALVIFLSHEHGCECTPTGLIGLIRLNLVNINVYLVNTCNSWV